MTDETFSNVARITGGQSKGLIYATGYTGKTPVELKDIAETLGALAG